MRLFLMMKMKKKMKDYKMQELKVINYLKIDKDLKGLADTQIKAFIDNFINESKTKF